MLEGFRQESVPSAEGFPLATFIRRAGSDEAGPPLLLVNGLGGHIVTWRHVVAHFAPQRTIASWDYRGIFASRFAPERLAAFRRGEISVAVEQQAADALAVMDALGLERAVLVGWSMGVQLGFEIAHLAPERVAGLVQICGAPGNTLATTALGAVGAKLAPPLMHGFRMVAERCGTALGRVVSSPIGFKLAKLAGMVAPTLDEPLAREIVRDYMALDFEVYNATLADLGRHDMTPFLASLHKPVLVVAGTRDAMTPVRVAQDMVARIADAELTVIEGGSHYLPIEYPAALNAAVASFLARRVA